MKEIVQRLKSDFSDATKVSIRNRSGKVYVRVEFGGGIIGYSFRNEEPNWLRVQTWLKKNVDSKAYMTSGGCGDATYRLPSLDSQELSVKTKQKSWQKEYEKCQREIKKAEKALQFWQNKMNNLL